QLKKMSETLEGQKKDVEGRIEAAKGELGQIEAEMAKVQADRDSRSSEINGELAKLDGSLGELNGERSRFLGDIDRQILSRYDRVRKARAGVALVAAVSGRCSGCNMMVPPQMFNELHRGTELHSCPSCHRILFMPANNGSGGN